jgi:hypothetical protein
MFNWKQAESQSLDSIEEAQAPALTGFRRLKKESLEEQYDAFAWRMRMTANREDQLNNYN